MRFQSSSCGNSPNITDHDSSIWIQGEKIFEDITIDKDYLNTNCIRKWEPDSAYDYRKNWHWTYF
jgi:hypothetical protein